MNQLNNNLIKWSEQLGQLASQLPASNPSSSLQGNPVSHLSLLLNHLQKRRSEDADKKFRINHFIMG